MSYQVLCRYRPFLGLGGWSGGPGGFPTRRYMETRVFRIYCDASPLRRDPRPLDGIFHAAYVSARMHYAHSHAVESRVLSKRELNQARKALVASRTAFRDGLKTLNEHASLTPLGHRVMDAARTYMSGCS